MTEGRFTRSPATLFVVIMGWSKIHNPFSCRITTLVQDNQTICDTYGTPSLPEIPRETWFNASKLRATACPSLPRNHPQKILTLLKQRYFLPGDFGKFRKIDEHQPSLGFLYQNFSTEPYIQAHKPCHESVATQPSLIICSSSHKIKAFYARNVYAMTIAGNMGTYHFTSNHHHSP